MGYGKKTDLESGRTLNLDATYYAIIKPAAEDLNLRCIRCDEVMQSGVIDKPMYELLLRADLVVADISTANANALYELGVRHALRPFSTVIMAEEDGRLYFDLNHINTFKYKHLGEDIGYSEAVRARQALARLLQKVLDDACTDSPVYTYLPALRAPRSSDEEFEQIVERAESSEQRLAFFMDEAGKAMRENRFTAAIEFLDAANRMKSGDPYLIQQLALATYKSKLPDEVGALRRAEGIIAQLEPYTSNDPETLGIAGAIQKRLWQSLADVDNLNNAIKLYGRGFETGRDYYRGENYALCLLYRAEIQADPSEAQYDMMSSRKVLEKITEFLAAVVTDPERQRRPDWKWVLASLANCHHALGQIKKAEDFEREFLNTGPADWEIETFRKNKAEFSRIMPRV